MVPNGIKRKRLKDLVAHTSSSETTENHGKVQLFRRMLKDENFREAIDLAVMKASLFWYNMLPSCGLH